MSPSISGDRAVSSVVKSQSEIGVSSVISTALLVSARTVECVSSGEWVEQKFVRSTQRLVQQAVGYLFGTHDRRDVRVGAGYTRKQ